MQYLSTVNCDGSGSGLTIGRVDTQVYGDRGDALVGPRHAVSLRFNLLPNFIEICELLPLTVEELCVFWRKQRVEGGRRATSG